MDRVYLIGFMGAGKSTLGRRWAEAFQAGFVETDELVEQQSGSTIPELFAKEGEPVFREWERKILMQTVLLENTLVSCGGGSPCYLDTMDWLLQNGTVIFIDEDFEIVYQRISTREGRPLASGRSREELHALYTQRLPVYEKAHIRFIPGVTEEQIIARLFLP